MKKHHYYISLLVVLMLCVSCGDNDETDGGSSLDDGGRFAVILQDVEYSLTVKVGGSVTKIDSNSNEDISLVGAPVFTDEDVARPLVMTVTGEYVSGTLTLQNIDGTFSGKLRLPVGIADTLDLVGVIEIPAAGGDDDDRSVVSLDDLMRKCGHRYTARFRYNATDSVEITDSKAYFEFFMSPCQRWLKVNNDRYSMSEDGKVWIAVDGKSSVMTNFYRITYDKVDGGKLYTIDRSGLVDLGIYNTLWADRNVGAVNIEDDGGYYYWYDAITCVDAPLELPSGGATETVDNDFYNLCQLYEYWGEYKGARGRYFLASGCYDVNRDPFVFLPASGVKIAGIVSSQGDYGLYWAETEESSTEAYRLYFHNWSCSYDAFQYKNFGGHTVRAVRRGNAVKDEDDNGGGNVADTTQSDVSSPQLYFPYSEYDVNDVAVWYKQKDAPDDDFMVLYCFKDYRFFVGKTQIIGGVLVGTPFGSGSIEVVAGSADDPRNVTLLATVNELDGNKFDVTFKDGIGNILGFYMEYQELDKMFELLGIQ